MIYTCTITPSIDYTTYLSEFRNGKLNRSKEVYYYPGGKGINVSRVLQRLGVNNTALGFAGGFTGSYIESFLQREGIQTAFIQTEEITRINVKIKADKETELNGPGPELTEIQNEQLLAKAESLQSGDWFILAGTLPDSIDYNKLFSICRKNEVHFVLDTSGSALKQLIKVKPFLVKPNEKELGELFQTIITTKNQAIHYAQQLIKEGLQHVIVSLGSEGAILVTEKDVFTAEAPKGKAVNTVGAGDSLVSGFIASYISNHNVKEAFRYAVAAGTATAFQSDLCNKDDVEKLLNQVKVKSYIE